MNTIFKTSGTVTLTDEIQEYVHERLQKTVKLLNPNDTAALCEVELGTTSAARTGAQYRAELNLKIARDFVRAEATAPTMLQAIDEATHDLRNEVKKHHDRSRSLYRRGAAKIKSLFGRS